MESSKSIWRGLKLTDGKVALSTAAVDTAKTEGGDPFLAGLPKTADGAIAVTAIGGVVVVPAPPGSGTFFLKSADGTISWQPS